DGRAGHDAHVVGEVADDVEVLRPAAAALDPLEHLVEPGRALPAGGTLAAALVGEEAAGVEQVIDHARLLVHDRHGRRAEAEAAGLADVLEVELRVELVGRHDAHADPSGDDRLGLAALPDAAAVLVDQLAGRDAERQLDADLAVDVPGDGVQLRPVALGRADR